MNKLTTEQFVERSRVIHNNRYDYSLVKYTKSSNRVKIICPIHGIFEQLATLHLKGFNCQECSGLKG
jgi:hypothetical protein